MIQGLPGRGLLQVLHRGVQKRSPRGRQDDPTDLFLPVPRQDLEDGAVLAVDGQETRAAISDFFDQDLPGHDQRFFVGDGDLFPCLRCSERGEKADAAHQGGNNHPGFRQVATSISPSAPDRIRVGKEERFCRR